MKSYYHRLIHNRKTQLMILLITLIVLSDILILINNFSSAWLIPHLATFLAGSSMGHIPQIILIWFLPVFLLIMGSDNYIQDYKTGYRNIVASKEGRKRYYKTMLFGNMSFTFLVIVLSLLLNMIIAYLVFKEGTYDMGNSLSIYSENPLFTLVYSYPLASNIVYIIIFGFFASLCAGMATAISWIFPDVKYTYPLSFAIWFSQILGLRYSIALIFQPFNEVYLEDFIIIFIKSAILFITIIIFAFIYKVKSNEV